MRKKSIEKQSARGSPMGIGNLWREGLTDSSWNERVTKCHTVSEMTDEK